MDSNQGTATVVAVVRRQVSSPAHRLQIVMQRQEALH